MTMCRKHGNPVTALECPHCRYESFCPRCKRCWRETTGFCGEPCRTGDEADQDQG